MILLKVKERSFDTEVGRVLLAQDVQNVRLVVNSIINDRRGHQLAPRWGQLNRLLSNLLNFRQVQVVLWDDQAQVDQVIQAFADAGVIQVSYADPWLSFMKYV